MPLARDEPPDNGRLGTAPRHGLRSATASALRGCTTSPSRDPRRRERLLADHPPVRHDADLADPEPRAEAIHDGDQGRHIGDVARPEFAADRPPLAIEDRADDHLVEVRAMILAEASLAEFGAAVALEVDRGGIEEDRLQAGEQISPVGKQVLLDPVFGTAGSKRRLSLRLIVRQHGAQPGHGPVEVMKLKHSTSGDLVVRLPLVSRPIAAGIEEAMEHGEKDRSLEVELVSSSIQKVLDNALTRSVARVARRGAWVRGVGW